jgi:hypothetical protein
VLALDRAILAFLRRHHVPGDVALVAAGGIAVWVLSMTISTYKDFYLSMHAWLPGLGVAVALAAGVLAATVARRWEHAGSPDRAMAALGRVAVVGAVVLLQIAPMQIT